MTQLLRQVSNQAHNCHLPYTCWLSFADPAEETEIELHEEGGNQHEGENHSILDEGNNVQPEAGVADEAKVDDEVKIEENARETVVSSEEPVGEGKHGDINQGNNEGSEEPESKEGQDAVETIHEETKPEADNVAQKKQGSHGNKKESPAAYNDAIEETKNKLL